MKIAAMADLHVGAVPRAQERMRVFWEAAKREQVDMVINLGDFAAPKEENQWVADSWKNCPLPHALVLGNHDMDESDKSRYMRFFGLKRSYDSFAVGGIQWILLDTNYFNFGGVCYDYAHANYYDKKRECLGDLQIAWLREVLEKSTMPCVLLSHEGLHYAGDKDKIWPVLREFRDKIAVCINGHNHVDGLTVLEGIGFLEVVSMSQHWLGTDAERLTLQECNGYFSPREFEDYQFLRYMAPYENAMYEIIEFDLDNKCVSVRGSESAFVGRSPRERGHSGTMHGIEQSTKVKEKTFYWGR